MITKTNTVRPSVDFRAVAIPRPGIELADAFDRWCAAHCENRVLDYGDKLEPVLLVGKEKSRTVAYEFVPEVSPPGFTIEDAMAHMRAAGFNVQGHKGNTILVCEILGDTDGFDRSEPGVDSVRQADVREHELQRRARGADWKRGR